MGLESIGKAAERQLVLLYFCDIQIQWDAFVYRQS